ncbi:hypothetical protein MBLNU459_g3823t1 [Dothideomycetes sp. NU459]
MVRDFRQEVGSVETLPKALSDSEGSPSVLEETSPNEGDTFEPSSPWSNSLAICSQISSLMKPTLDCPSLRRESKGDKTTYLVHFPRPERLQYCLRVFFEHFDCYFPCVRWTTLGQRLSETFSALNYCEKKTVLQVSAEHYKMVGIICSALAFSMHFQIQTDPTDLRPGWKYYILGRNLMQHFEGNGDTDADLLMYHTITSTFLLPGEMLHSASIHIAQARQIAYKIGLNDQSQWREAPHDLASRKNLWWVLYFLDKRIAQKTGTAYLIRPNEVAVHDFREDKSVYTPGDSGFLQTMITYSHCWARIWDNFFAPNAPYTKDWDAIQIEDARIVVLHQNTPEQLTWSTKESQLYVSRGESGIQVRRRLLIYLVCSQNELTSCFPLLIESPETQMPATEHSAYIFV